MTEQTATRPRRPGTRTVQSFINRNRAAVVVGLIAVLASSGTSAAASYLVLAATNSAGATTTLKTGANGAVLALNNTNSTGGTSAKGLAITVPTGRAPITINSSAGKATNLNADKLDGVDASAFGRIADFSRTTNATSGDYRDMVTLRGLTVSSQSHVANGNLLTCDLFATTTAAGQLDNAWIYDAPDSEPLTLSSGTATPTTKFFVARGRGNGSRSVGQLVFRNASLGRTMTLAYSVYGIPHPDVNGQGCTWQGTVTAGGF